MPTLEMYSVCNEATQIQLKMKTRPVCMLFLILVGLPIFGFYWIPASFIFFPFTFYLETSCSRCSRFLHQYPAWRSDFQKDDKLSCCGTEETFLEPFCACLLYLSLPLLVEVFYVGRMYPGSMTQFDKSLIEWNSFQQHFVTTVSQLGPFDGPITDFERNYKYRTFNFSGIRYLAVYLGEEYKTGLRCKFISKSRKALQIPDFHMCFENTEDDWAQCKFGSGDVPVIAGCYMEDLGYVENVTYVLCKKGWVRPVDRGVYECKDEEAGNFHWTVFPFF